jgi:hypothetical protein
MAVLLQRVARAASGKLFSRASRLCALAVGGVAVAAIVVAPVQAAISWDGQAGTQWWFDPVNWNANSNANNVLPPIDPISSGDAQINIGTGGAWNVTGEGVVYDPANDDFFDDADSISFPTGSTLTMTAGVMRDYGPDHQERRSGDRKHDDRRPLRQHCSVAEPRQDRPDRRLITHSQSNA